MNYELLREQLRADEGYETHPYVCPAGKQTIGIGHNLTDNGLHDDVILHQFSIDIEQAINVCYSVFDRWPLLPDMAQVVLANMAFQLGYRLSSFKKLIDAVDKEEWDKAAIEMLDSKWAVQTPERANRLAEIMVNVNDYT